MLPFILKHYRNSQQGIALITSMYTMIILAALGTFFIADMISKSRTLGSYSESKLALQMANTGAAFAMHYLGDLYNNQSQGCSVTSCPIWSNTYTIDTSKTDMQQGIDFSGVTFKLSTVTTSGQNRTYSLTLPATLPASSGYLPREIAPGRLGGFEVTIKIKLRTPSPDPDDIYSVEYMEFTSKGTVYSSNGVKLATREVITRTRRNFGLGTAFYQNWNGWDLPGAAPPNQTEGTDSAGGVGDNFLFKGVALSGGDSPYAKSTAGTIRAVDQDGNSSNDAKFLGNTLLNGSKTAQENVGNPSIFVGPAVKYEIGTVSFPTGNPFGPAVGNTAPAHMKRLYELALADRAVFTTPSNQQSEVKGDGTDSAGYLVEKFKDEEIHRKPGFAITDVSFDKNSNGDSVITVKRIGYYSGKVISETTIEPTALSNGVIYVQGGNVRVHNGRDYKNDKRNTAGLSEGRVTIVANQGEAFYNSSGTDITPTDLSNSSRYMSNQNGSQTFSDGGTYVNGKYITANPNNTNDSYYNRTIFISETDYNSLKPQNTPNGAPIKINGKWWWKAPSELDPSNTQKSYDAALSQFGVSEGSITITGDVTYQGGDEGAGLGLIARNYLMIADKDANAKNTTDFNGDGTQNDLDRQLTIQAVMLSTNHSLQWEGSTVLNSNVPGDSFINQDFYFNPNIPKEAIDEKKPNPITPLVGASQVGKFWPFSLKGELTAPFLDVEGDTSGNGYLKQQYSSDSNTITDLPPGFPRLSFSQLQAMSSYLTIRYEVINYTDKGALKEKQ